MDNIFNMSSRINGTKFMKEMLSELSDRELLEAIYTYLLLKDAVDDLTRRATNDPKFIWRSVKDSLPDNEDNVLAGCWCKNRFKYVVQASYHKNRRLWRDNIEGFEVEDVTHWMPIMKLERK